MIWSAGIVWGKISRGEKGGDIVSWDGWWPLDAPAAKTKKIRQHNILGVVASSRVVRWWVGRGLEVRFSNPGRSYGGRLSSQLSIESRRDLACRVLAIFDIVPTFPTRFGGGLLSC